MSSGQIWHVRRSASRPARSTTFQPGEGEVGISRRQQQHLSNGTLRPSDTARGNHEALAQCRRQEAQRVEAVTCCCAARRAQQSSSSSVLPTLLPVWGCWRAAHHPSLLPAPDVVGRCGGFFSLSETAGDSGPESHQDGMHSDSNNQRQGQLATQHSALDNRDLTAGAGGPISSVG